MPIHDWTRVDAGIFHDFHLEWMSSLKRAMNDGVLPADYYALAEQVTGGLHPDVLTLHHDHPPKGNNGSSGTGTSSFSSSAETDMYAQKRRRLAIRHVSDDRVTAIIEIVSPGNKASQHALRSFVEKSLEILTEGIHLQILDMFPPGRRDPHRIHAAIWAEIKDDLFTLPLDKPLTLASYAAGAITRAFIEPVAVGDSLPDLPLFLEPELYVQTPLERTYQAAFAGVPLRWREVLTN